MYINLSRLLYPGMTVYPGDTGFTCRQVADFPADGYRLSEFSMGAHNGTHVDAPAHYIPGGAEIDQMPEKLMYGRAAVVKSLDHIREGMLRVALTEDYDITEAQALSIVRKGVKLLVVPGMTVGGEKTHKILLSSGCWICENAATEGLPAGEYDFYCVPLLIMNGEAAPATVLAQKIR